VPLTLLTLFEFLVKVGVWEDFGWERLVLLWG